MTTLWVLRQLLLRDLWPGQHWRALAGALALCVALLGAAPARGEDETRLAQAGDPAAQAAAPDTEPDPAEAELLAQAEPPAEAEPPADAEPPAEAEPPAQTAPAPASGIEEIVVRGAESEATQDFQSGDSVTGFGAEDLAALGAQSIADLAEFTPNLEVVTAGSTTPTFFIRGVGLNDFNSNSSGAVSIYQDDVALNAPALQLGTLFDVEAVNVMRGPQGSGLARNSSAGAIKVYNRKPTGELNGYLNSELGNYDYRDFQGALEAPIYQDMLAGRLAFRFTERDGTMENRCGNAPPRSARVPVPPNGGANGLRAQGKRSTDAPWSICGEPVTPIVDGDRFSKIPEGLAEAVNNLNNWAARGTLLFQPTLDMSWLVNAHGSQRDELSRLGQSIGTRGFYCLNGDVENCGFAGQSDESQVDGVLGGLQGTGGDAYQPEEIQRRLIELAPCFEGVPLFPTGTCDLPQNRASANAAKLQVMKELSENLDSDPWAGDFNRTGPTQNNTWGTYVKGDVVLPWGLQLNSVSGYDGYDRLIDLDLDFSPETLFQILTDDQGWQFYQDLRLQGQLGEAELPVRWDVGGWLLREVLDVVVTNDFGILQAFGVGQRDYTQELWSTAGYGHLSFDFWERFTLDGGFRYNWEEKDLDYLLITGGGEPLEQKLNDAWSAPTGTVRLTFRFREDTHVFWKYSRGWKPGTYNATGSPDTLVTTAQPETIDAFEAGVRGSWLDGRLGIDFSTFYYNYTDYQIFTAQQFANGSPEFVIINADNAEVYGAEIDAVLRPWLGAFLNVRFGWLETQFLDFVQIQQDVIVQGGTRVTVNRELQNTGNPLLNSPRFKVSLTAEQTLPLGRWGSLTARYDGVWTDITYYDATEGFGLPNNDNVHPLPPDTIAQPAFWLHNLRVSYRLPGGRIEVAGFVRNLENTSYKTFAFDGTTFNGTSIYFVGDPRTYGGALVVNF